VVPSNACACGWQPQLSDSISPECDAWREYCFLSGPVAQRVVANIQAALHPGMQLHRSHVWLLESPHEAVVRQDVWEVVRLAGLSSIHVGRYQLHVRSNTGQGSGGSDPGLHQVTIEEMWRLPSQSQPSHVPATPVEGAGQHAAAHFWSLL
jgi:hypothetical protein